MKIWKKRELLRNRRKNITIQEIKKREPTIWKLQRKIDIHIEKWKCENWEDRENIKAGNWKYENWKEKIPLL